MAMTDDANESNDHQGPDIREMLVLHVGGHLLGVFTENVAGIAAEKLPVPLPRAPVSVLGVIAFRGRMLTVLDLRPSLGEPANEAGPGIIVALNGEEQVAIAADSSRGAIQVFSGDIDRAPTAGGPAILFGTLSRNGDQIELIDVSRLFQVVTMGQQNRRRRRF